MRCACANLASDTQAFEPEATQTPQLKPERQATQRDTAWGQNGGNPGTWRVQTQNTGPPPRGTQRVRAGGRGAMTEENVGEIGSEFTKSSQKYPSPT